MWLLENQGNVFEGKIIGGPAGRRALTVLQAGAFGCDQANSTSSAGRYRNVCDQDA